MLSGAYLSEKNLPNPPQKRKKTRKKDKFFLCQHIFLAWQLIYVDLREKYVEMREKCWHVDMKLIYVSMHLLMSKCKIYTICWHATYHCQQAAHGHTNLACQYHKLHVNIKVVLQHKLVACQHFILHINITLLHVSINTLHVDIDKLHVNIFIQQVNIKEAYCMLEVTSGWFWICFFF